MAYRALGTVVGAWMSLLGSLSGGAAHAVPPYAGGLLNPFGGFCAESYRWDAFAKGFESAFRGHEVRPLFNDEGCFRLGRQYGLTQYAADLRSRGCRADFERGVLGGIKIDPSTRGNRCLDAGYSVGIATLHVDAREHNPAVVGQVCVSAYERGSSDGKASYGLNLPAELVERECYHAGYNDGQMFRSVAP